MSLRLYSITVDGFDPYTHKASNAGKAKWSAFLAFDDAGYARHLGSNQSERFKQFLKRTTCHAMGKSRP